MTRHADADDFSYAEPDDPRLKRFFIRLIERMSGQPYLKQLYEDHRANPQPGESFWDAAVRSLELTIVCNEDALARWPRRRSADRRFQSSVRRPRRRGDLSPGQPRARRFSRADKCRADARRSGARIPPADRFRGVRRGGEDQPAIRAAKARLLGGGSSSFSRPAKSRPRPGCGTGARSMRNGKPIPAA